MRARYTLVRKDELKDGTVNVYMGAGELSGGSGILLRTIIEKIREAITEVPPPPVDETTPPPETETPPPTMSGGPMMVPPDEPPTRLPAGAALVLTGAPGHQFTDPVGTVYDVLIAPVP